MVNVIIDGKTIEVPEGTTVLRAAAAAGVEIPTLCDHPQLTPYGSCRLCLVEVEGARTLQTACTLPVTNNMVVRTDNERIRAARKFVLTLIFSERNHFCPYCQVSGGDCELQNAAYHEEMSYWPLQPTWQTYSVDASHPYFVLDHNRCILCRRCVRACAEMVGNFTLGFEERGAKSFLIADYGVPLGESSCISCGTCVQICPTGALIDRQSAYRGRETQVETVSSVCVGCSVGCAAKLLVRDNNLVRIEGDWDAELNHGVLCEAGRFAPMAEKRERIATPLVRKNGALKAATWDEALDVIAAKVKEGNVAALASTRLPVETLAKFKSLFADGLKGSRATSIEEGFPTAAAAALADELGQAFETGLEALKAADCIVCVNADLAEEHQVAGFFVKRSLPLGADLITIDATANGLDKEASVALKGSEKDTLLALAQAVAGGAAASEELQAAAQKLAAAEHAVFVYGKLDSATLKALVDLSKAVKGSALLGIKGKANSLAAALLRLDQAFDPKGAAAVYLALGDDQPSQRLLQKLEGVPFLAVQASYVSKLTAAADVVLPVEMWAELEGHYLNLDGRLQQAHKVLNAPAEVRSNQAALEALAARLGVTLSDDWQKQLNARVPAVALAAA